MRESEKYIKQRLSKGGDCTAKSQEFIFAPAAYRAAELFSSEILNKAIHSIRLSKSVNGIKGLCTKSAVIKILKELKETKFISK